MADLQRPVDVKGHLDVADTVVDALPWVLGSSQAQRKAARGRVSALAHQVAALIAGGWHADEIRQVLAAVETAATAPDAGAQERQWRSALKRAKNERRTASRAATVPEARSGGTVPSPVDAARE